MAEHPLLIHTAALSVDGIRILESCEPSSLELDSESVKYTAPLSIDCTASKDGTVVSVLAIVNTVTERVCARCLDVSQVTVHRRFQWYFKQTEQPVIDVLDEVRQELVLEDPLAQAQWCREDCKGLCPVCGVNWNHETCGHASPGRTQTHA